MKQLLLNCPVDFVTGERTNGTVSVAGKWATMVSLPAASLKVVVDRRGPM